MKGFYLQNVREIDSLEHHFYVLHSKRPLRTSKNGYIEVQTLNLIFSELSFWYIEHFDSKVATSLDMKPKAMMFSMLMTSNKEILI